ncbi:hypothetical protein SDC9_125545 [bioreactor metagenome]|uniref:Uncharacterized protein n=1 Tax=bioreactor metagenome TaxID=1076179 RepID=A0A645CNS9_9ZZZZ
MVKAKCWFDLCGRDSGLTFFVLAPPVSGVLVVVGAVCWGCPPGTLPSPELVHHVPRLPPGTHGFAGGAVPSQAGPAGLTYIHLIETTNHKKARTPTKPLFVEVLAFNIFQLFIHNGARDLFRQPDSCCRAPDRRDLCFPCRTIRPSAASSLFHPEIAAGILRYCAQSFLSSAPFFGKPDNRQT